MGHDYWFEVEQYKSDALAQCFFWWLDCGQAFGFTCGRQRGLDAGYIASDSTVLQAWKITCCSTRTCFILKSKYRCLIPGSEHCHFVSHLVKDSVNILLFR